MSFRLYNTLSGEVEEVRPSAPPEVRMYACGPTVYNRAHIGNFRTFVATDVLRRALTYCGFRVREVMNLTDVDDRIIKLAAEAGQEIGPFTAAHIAAFEADMKALRMERPEIVPKATEHIAEMVELIGKLIARGHTYVADGSVYFRIGSFPDYGKLARLDVSGMKAGARVDTDKYEKEDARDFVLWKLKADEPAWAQWDAPFGKGRPGWHIECSAMGMKYLGDTLDLHAGGVDLIFPHHENEIAQSQCGTGHPFVRHWMHVEHLLVNEETMSKSKGNFFTLPDLVEAGHSPEAVRYLLAQAHYRKQLNFSFEGLDQAKAALERIHGAVRRLGEVETAGPASAAALEAGERAETAFAAALRDDLNAPEAIAAVHGLVTDANQLLAGGALNAAGAGALRERFERMDRVFGVLLPAGEDRLEADLQALFDARQEARRARDFRRADEVRADLERRGIVLEDTPRGTRWRRS
ncbi:MAG: cysteine--tRNA ligase [Vicinamibacteria bacterium]|jgi:cysteinyl-tRNA synthetase|nr:cysteine--tRNA ligase [Vicinamibacteria bacterium]